MGSEIPGASLPGDVVTWFLLLGAIYGALLAVLAAIEKALEFFGNDRKLLRPFGGLIVPVGWAAWSTTLISAYPGPVTVLVALAGVMAITIVAARLAENCKA